MLFRFHKRRKISDSLFHHARAFDHLRQKHFPRAKEFAHHFHSVHQRPFDDLQRPSGNGTRFFSIGLNKFGDAVHQRVAQARSHGFLAPFLVDGGAFFFDALEFLRVINEPIGRIRAAIEQHVFHMLEQFRFNLLVHFEHAGIHDAHIQTSLNGVKQKR